MKKKNILILGASSYVGSGIYFDLKDKYQVTGTYKGNRLSEKFLKLNLSNQNNLEEAIKKIKPDIIIHAANYTRSSLSKVTDFSLINEKVTDFVIETANRNKAKLIFMSSLAAENPDNIYGELKLESENKIINQVKDYLIIRPSLTVGLSPNTKNDKFFNRILSYFEGKEVAFDTSWKLQPTYIGHLAQVIDRVIINNDWNKTISIYFDEVVTQYQIAKEILEPFKMVPKSVDLKLNIPVSTADLTYFKNLDFQVKNYLEMINTIKEEIKNKDKFKL